MFDFNVNIGVAGWALVIVASLAAGVLLQLIGDVQFGYEWIATAIGFGVGAVIASEFIVGLRTFEPVWDNLALVPAAAGAAVVGLIVAFLARYATGGSFVHSASAA